MTFRTMSLAALALSMVGASIAFGSVPANAGACSDQTGGSNNRVMWTGSGYTCAYTADNGDNKIGSYSTEVWTSSTAPGYEKRFKCQRNSGGVSISSVYTNSGGANVGSSITYTAFNTQDGSRHWTGAVLWNTPKGGEGAASQFRDNCDGYTIKSNLFYDPTVALSGPTYVDAGAPGSYEISVATPDGGGPATGAVSLFHQASVDQKSPNPPSRACDGSAKQTTDVLVGQASLVNGKATITNNWYGPSSYKLYAAYGGMPLGSGGVPPYCAAPPVSGLTAGISNTILLSSGQRSAPLEGVSATLPAERGDAGVRLPKIKVVNAQATTPSMPTARCKSGWVPLQSNVSSPTEVISESDVTWTARGATVRKGTLPDGTQINLQTVCRPKNASAFTLKRAIYGSRWNDRLTSGSKSSVMFGGMGKDVLLVNSQRTLALGGRDGDVITVSAKSSAANGGPGRDRLISNAGGGVLLVGGFGKDKLVGAAGSATRLNVADGRPGDRAVCRGTKNRVIADPGDRLIGKCVRVTPAS